MIMTILLCLFAWLTGLTGYYVVRNEILYVHALKVQISWSMSIVLPLIMLFSLVYIAPYGIWILEFLFVFFFMSVYAAQTIFFTLRYAKHQPVASTASIKQSSKKNKAHS
jgi:ABC-type uncharacterized transport system permease subunit